MKYKSSNAIIGLLALLSVTFVGCATVPPDYEGDDAGYAVAAIAASHGTSYSMYRLMFREAGVDQENRFIYLQESTLSKGDDYKDADETGAVDVKPLRPGNYEIYNVDTFYNTGFVQNNYFLKEDISIPFTVYSGEVTYLGHFQANKITGENVFGITIPAGAFFVVSDKEDHDIEIARNKLPKIADLKVRNSFARDSYAAVPGFVMAEER